MEEDAQQMEEDTDANCANDKSVDIAKLFDSATPLVERLCPYLIKSQELKAPSTKRRQRNNFVVVFGIVVATSALAWCGTMDGSGAMVIFGAVLYYVFRNASTNNLIDGILHPK